MNVLFGMNFREDRIWVDGNNNIGVYELIYCRINIKKNNINKTNIRRSKDFLGCYVVETISGMTMRIPKENAWGCIWCKFITINIQSMYIAYTTKNTKMLISRCFMKEKLV